MKNFKKVLAIILALSIVMLFAVGCGDNSTGSGSGSGSSAGSVSGSGDAETDGDSEEGNAADGEPIIIGFYAPLSGANAAIGESLKVGVEMAINEINSSGGVNGRPLQAIYEDDESDATTGVNVINKFVNQDDVDIIIGTTMTTVMMAALEVSESAGVVMITPCASGTSVTNSGYKYVARVQASDEQQARACVEHVIDAGYERIGLMHSNDDAGTQARDVILQVAAEHGVELATVEAFDYSSPDYKPQLQNIRAADCDALISWCTYQAGATIANQKAEIGLKDLPQFGGGGLTNVKLFELAGENAVGIVNSQTFLAGADAVNDFSAKFIDNFTAANGKAPDSNNAMAYDTVYVAAEALKHSIDTTGDIDSDAIMDGIHAIQGMELATGNISFDERGDSIREKILMCELQEDGTYQLVN